MHSSRRPSNTDHQLQAVNNFSLPMVSLHSSILNLKSQQESHYKYEALLDEGIYIFLGRSIFRCFFTLLSFVTNLKSKEKTEDQVGEEFKQTHFFTVLQPGC